MNRYAIINDYNIIVNIVILDQDIIVHDVNYVNINDKPWLSIGMNIEDTDPNMDASSIIQKKDFHLKTLFNDVEKEQFRSVCGIISSILKNEQVNETDRNVFLSCEDKKEILRSYSLITADTSYEEWLFEIMKKLQDVQQRMLNSLQEMSEKK